MSVCHIVGAGDFTAVPVKNEGDIIVAADGGYEHLKNAGITPDVCIGDFDSLGYVPSGENVIKLPVEKDDTDIIAASRWARDNGYNEIYLYGVLGGSRFSHSLASIQTLLFIDSLGMKGRIIGDNSVITVLSNDKIEIPKMEKGDVSVFSMTESSIVSLKGLKYLLDEYEIKNTFPLGASNSFIGEKAEISVHKGTCIIVFENFK